MFGWIPGMSAEDAARREIENRQLKDDGTGIREGKWNWQDKFGGFLGGYDKAEVEKLAQIQRDEALQTKIDTKYGTTGTELQGLGLNTSYKGDVTGLTEVELARQTQGDLSKLTAALNYLNIENADASDLKPDSTATGIIQSGTKLKSDNKKEAETKVQKEKERLEGREDNLLLMQMLQNNRQSDREFQYRMAQDAYNNRRLDMQDARAERKDRQAALQQMMAGLAQMGASIAI